MTEKLLDRVLIVMPEYLEDILWCLPVGQTYSMYGRWKLDRTPDEFVICREEYEFLARLVFPHASFHRNVSDLDLASFDAVIVFDRERAFRIGEPTKKTAIESYSILCGAAPQLMLPVMGESLVQDELKIAFVQRSSLDYRGSEYRYPFSEQREVFEKAFVGANLVEVSNEMPLKEAYEEIGSAAFVLGVVGGFTLLAAAMMKPLFEIHPEKSLVFREWSAKWANPFYRVMPAEIEQIPVDFLVSNFDKFIGEVMKKRGKICSTTHQHSFAPVAEPSIPMAQ